MVGWIDARCTSFGACVFAQYPRSCEQFLIKWRDPFVVVGRQPRSKRGRISLGLWPKLRKEKAQGVLRQPETHLALW